MNAAAVARLEAALDAARRAGARALVPGASPPRRRAYWTASVHELPDGCATDVAGYTDVEVFGLDLRIEVIDTDDEAVAVLEASPYGFANAVFTASDARFEAIAARTRSGILNRNRSTNLASPRLPFGGVGRSGNYRPAGAWAHRNVTSPVAVRRHPARRDRAAPDDRAAPAGDRPGADGRAARRRGGRGGPGAASSTRAAADAAAAAARRQAAAERGAARLALCGRPRAEGEEAAGVSDHMRSSGPWMVSIDDAPLAVLDGMSQTATVVGGFAEDPVVRAYTEGGFADTLIHNADTAVRETWAAAEYANTLRQLVPGLPHVTFVASGAEANEKAMLLCRLNCERPNATKVLAFDQQLPRPHPARAASRPTRRAKRPLRAAPATRARSRRFRCGIRPPARSCSAPSGDQPHAPGGFFAAAASGDIAGLLDRHGDAKDDPLLAAEVASLAAVHAARSRPASTSS